MTRGPIALGAALFALVAAAPAGAAPVVTIDGPPEGCCTGLKRPAITGVAGAGAAVSPVTIQLFQGTAVDDSPDLTLTATAEASGRYSAVPSIHMADGPWTARASQSDASGESVSAPLTFVIDTVQPRPTITSPAAGASLATSTPTISGRAGTAAGDLPTVALILDGPGGEFSIQAPVGSDGVFSLVTPALPDGSYGLAVTQQDMAGNGATSVESGFAIDTRSPRTTIAGGPAPIGGSTRNVRVDFAASEPATFRCELDGDALAGCASPLVLRGLTRGRHELVVTAVDPAGNVDPTPARLAFAVDLARPRVAIAPRVLVGRGGQTSLRLRCPASQALGPCVGRVAVRRNGRSLLVRPARFRMQAGGSARVPARLNRTGRRLLARTGRVRVQVVIVAADGRGNVGRKTLRRTLVVPR